MTRQTVLFMFAMRVADSARKHCGSVPILSHEIDEIIDRHLEDWIDFRNIDLEPDALRVADFNLACDFAVNVFSAAIKQAARCRAIDGVPLDNSIRREISEADKHFGDHNE